MRQVFKDGKVVGYTRKFVGRTAQSMGSDPAYAAYPVSRNQSSVACASYQAARDYLFMVASKA